MIKYRYMGHSCELLKSGKHITYDLEYAHIRLLEDVYVNNRLKLLKGTEICTLIDYITKEELND